MVVSSSLRPFGVVPLNFTAVTTALTVVAAMLPGSATAQASDPDLLDRYLTEIEQLITNNDLEGARDKLAEATSADLQDESLEMINSQLRLLESLNSDATVITNNGKLTDADKLAATDLLDSLRVAIENGELGKVQRFTESTPATESLLSLIHI